MDGQITLSSDDARLYERGMTVAHSTDGDGIPDVGKSIGLGSGRMLYVGERPGEPGWCLCVYSESEPTIDIASNIDFDGACDLVDLIAGAIRAR